MREIRSELPYEVDEARARVKQLSDWRYHMAKRPLVIMAAATVVGYLIVPNKRDTPAIVVYRDAPVSSASTSSAVAAPPTKRGRLGGVAGAAATILARQLATLASQQIARKLSEDKARS